MPCNRKVIKPSQNEARLHSIFVFKDRISLSPASMIVIVETANGLPHAIPNSLLTNLARCFVTPGWLACNSSIYSCGQFAARITNLASPICRRQLLDVVRIIVFQLILLSLIVYSNPYFFLHTPHCFSWLECSLLWDVI